MPVDFQTPHRGETVIGGASFVWGSRTYVMAVINVTPDSFSGDGLDSNVEAITRQALLFQEAGADIVDVGGESTRPASIYAGAGPVSLDEELSRVLPAIGAMAGELTIPVSVDTYKSEVARQAIAAGASMINDVWALQRDPAIAGVAAEAGVPVILMHNQDGTNYDDLVPDVVRALQDRVETATQAGIAADKTIVDPGIGFGKNAEQNLEILRRLGEFGTLGRPLLVGTSASRRSATCLTCPSTSGWKVRPPPWPSPSPAGPTSSGSTT